MDGDTFSHQICCRFLITANSVVSPHRPSVLSKINNLSACSNFIFMALLILTLGKCTRQLLAEVVRRCEGGWGWGCAGAGESQLMSFFICYNCFGLRNT